MAQFKTYRNGDGPIEERIRAAVADFYQDQGKLPAAVIVHKSEVDDATAAVQTLNLGLEVRGCGGCLVPEVWLLPREKGGQDGRQE